MSQCAKMACVMCAAKRQYQVVLTMGLHPGVHATHKHPVVQVSAWAAVLLMFHNRVYLTLHSSFSGGFHVFVWGWGGGYPLENKQGGEGVPLGR